MFKCFLIAAGQCLCSLNILLSFNSVQLITVVIICFSTDIFGELALGGGRIVLVIVTVHRTLKGCMIVALFFLWRSLLSSSRVLFLSIMFAISSHPLLLPSYSFPVYSLESSPKSLESMVLILASTAKTLKSRLIHLPTLSSPPSLMLSSSLLCRILSDSG